MSCIFLKGKNNSFAELKNREKLNLGLKKSGKL